MSHKSSTPLETQSSESPASGNSGSQGGPSFLRFLIPAAILAVGVYFGLQAFQENEEGGESAAAPQQKGPPPSNVVVAPIEMISARDTQRVIGSLRAANRADVAAREEGAILEILVDEGDTVKKGDILVRLDARRLEAQIAQSQASLTVARGLISQRKAEDERSESDLAMKRKLYDQQAISESELLDAERESKVSQSLGKSARDSLLAAGAALKLLEVRRDDLVIRAPFDARVVARMSELGEWVRPGDAMMTLISEGVVEAWLQVPERFAGELSSGNVSVDIAGQTFEGTNLRVVPEADMSSRGITVIADIADPENRLVPGLSISAFLPVSSDEPRMAVPSDAVVTTYAGPAVFRATPSDSGGPPMAERLPVKVLFQQGGKVFVEGKGLAEGDLIVNKGNERLFPGTPLNPSTDPEGQEDPASRGPGATADNNPL